MAIYSLLNEKIPDYLYKSIKGQGKTVSSGNFVMPTSLITPIIDGELSNYFEWKKSGHYIVGHSGGSMHQVATILNYFNYGFDLDNIYLALKLNMEEKTKDLEMFNFNINFLEPVRNKISAKFDMNGNLTEFYILYESSKEKFFLSSEDIKFKSIMEIRIPLKILKLPENYKNIEFTVSVDKDNMEVERWPYQSSVIIPKPTKNFNMLSWTV